MSTFNSSVKTFSNLIPHIPNSINNSLLLLSEESLNFIANFSPTLFSIKLKFYLACLLICLLFIYFNLYLNLNMEIDEVVLESIFLILLKENAYVIHFSKKK